MCVSLELVIHCGPVEEVGLLDSILWCQLTVHDSRLLVMVMTLKFTVHFFILFIYLSYANIHESRFYIYFFFVQWVLEIGVRGYWSNGLSYLRSVIMMERAREKEKHTRVSQEVRYVIQVTTLPDCLFTFHKSMNIEREGERESPMCGYYSTGN